MTGHKPSKTGEYVCALRPDTPGVCVYRVSRNAYVCQSKDAQSCSPVFVVLVNRKAPDPLALERRAVRAHKCSSEQEERRDCG